MLSFVVMWISCFYTLLFIKPLSSSPLHNFVLLVDTSVWKAAVMLAYVFPGQQVGGLCRPWRCFVAFLRGRVRNSIRYMMGEDIRGVLCLEHVRVECWGSPGQRKMDTRNQLTMQGVLSSIGLTQVCCPMKGHRNETSHHRICPDMGSLWWCIVYVYVCVKYTGICRCGS